MLVFGDLATREAPKPAWERCFSDFLHAMERDGGAARHAALVTAYVEASRIAQACVDAQFRASGADAQTPLHAAAVDALRAMARVVRRSWESGGRETGGLDTGAHEAFLGHALQDEQEARVAEGFAFYALYPEACFAFAACEDDAVVIGIRSIGMALAPLLAEALGATLCITLRPQGHPFARTCALAPDLAALLRARSHARFFVIDEGPGLSGSSFAAVAEALESLGALRERICFVHSNASGPGAQASPATRERWETTRKHALESGPAIARALGDFRIVRDVAGGAWRDGHVHAQAPANRIYERRKFIVENGAGLWLAKFTGLGRMGAGKQRMIERLADAGFTPRAGAPAHGFVLQRWMPNARAPASLPRARLVAQVAAYIAFRARNLAALPYGGASMDELFTMTRHNIATAGHAPLASRAERFAHRLAALAGVERRIATDNRMHAWEWICDESGMLLKADACDHCAGHDLVGCRDAAWDVAGAIVEFAFDAGERAALQAHLEEAGVAVDAELLEFFGIAYCAFQLGAAHMAAQANAPWPDDAQRWRAEERRYLEVLGERLQP